jgi:hypothetical protein
VKLADFDLSGPFPASRSDDSGHYCLVNVPYGDNVPAADDPKRGLPESGIQHLCFRLGNKESPNVAHLSAEHPRATVDFRIPYRAAFLAIHLSDAITGKPKFALFYRLSAQKDPERNYMTGSQSAKDALLLPPNEKILLKVSAPGSREWRYDNSPGYVLNLLPGELSSSYFSRAERTCSGSTISGFELKWAKARSLTLEDLLR